MVQMHLGEGGQAAADFPHSGDLKESDFRFALLRRRLECGLGVRFGLIGVFDFLLHLGVVGVGDGHPLQLLSLLCCRVTRALVLAE